MKCAKCNADLSDGNNFCPNCGGKIEKPTSTNGNPSIEPTSETKKGEWLLGFRSNKLWKKLLSAAYLVLWCFALLFLIIQPKLGQLTTFDFLLAKLFRVLVCIMFLSPYIFLSNTKLRNMLPLFKQHKTSDSILGMIIVIACIFVLICIVNGMHSAEYRADMKNHADIVVSSTDADCTNDGQIQYECEYCGREKTETIDALGHDMKPIPSTHTNGKIIYKCSRCGIEETETQEKTEAEVVEKPLSFLHDFSIYGYSADQIESMRTVLTNVGITEITELEIEPVVSGMQVIQGIAFKDESFGGGMKEVRVQFNIENGVIYLVAIYCPSYMTSNQTPYLSGLTNRRADLYYDVEGGYLKKIDWENKAVVDYN